MRLSLFPFLLFWWDWHCAGTKALMGEDSGSLAQTKARTPDTLAFFTLSSQLGLLKKVSDGVELSWSLQSFCYAVRENRKCALSSPAAYDAADTNNSHLQKSIWAAKVKLYPGTLFTRKYNTQAIRSQTWESGRHFLGWGEAVNIYYQASSENQFWKTYIQDWAWEHENTLPAFMLRESAVISTHQLMESVNIWVSVRLSERPTNQVTKPYMSKRSKCRTNTFNETQYEMHCQGFEFHIVVTIEETTTYQVFIWVQTTSIILEDHENIFYFLAAYSYEGVFFHVVRPKQHCNY